MASPLGAEGINRNSCWCAARSVAFHYGTKLDAASRMRLFKAINRGPTLYETVMSGLGRTAALQNGYDSAAQQQQPRPPV